MQRTKGARWQRREPQRDQRDRPPSGGQFKSLLPHVLHNAVAALDGTSVAVTGIGDGGTRRRHCDCLRNRVVTSLNRVGGGDRKEGKSEHGESRDTREHLCCQSGSAEKVGSAVSQLTALSDAFITTIFAFDHSHTPRDYSDI